RTGGALRRRRHALLAEQLDGVVEVAVRLLERALALHHPRARRIAKLLDHRRGDVGHALSPSLTAVVSPGSVTSYSGASATSSAFGAASSSAAAAAAASASFFAARISPLATRCLPASIPSAIARTISSHERMASSLPGMTYSAS